MHSFASKHDFCVWLNQFSHPHLIANWADQPHVVTLSNEHLLRVVLPFAAKEIKEQLAQWIETQIENNQIDCIAYEILVRPSTLRTTVDKSIRGVKNVIAVTSAKGGVGKSTTAVNLALALSHSGAKVGLLDADVYGPSVPLMLGTTDAKPGVVDNKWMQPIEVQGIYTHSIGYLIDKANAAIWRGPMASKALEQLVRETHWPDLDYLVIDMPPGTGDIQLTLAQQIPVTGAVIVTTPQDLALADARKGAAMFDEVDVPVVGIVENMSYHVCRHCGAKEALFGSGGAQTLAAECGLSLLAQLPLHIAMREDIDAGIPTVARRPESEHAGYYLQLAERIASTLYWQGHVKPDAIDIALV